PDPGPRHSKPIGGGGHGRQRGFFRPLACAKLTIPPAGSGSSRASSVFLIPASGFFFLLRQLRNHVGPRIALVPGQRPKEGLEVLLLVFAELEGTEEDRQVRVLRLAFVGDLLV